MLTLGLSDFRLFVVFAGARQVLSVSSMVSVEEQQCILTCHVLLRKRSLEAMDGVDAVQSRA